jgi:hypothetical protein
MVKKIILLALIIVSIVSCKSNNAFKYSQEFVASETKLMPSIENTENKVGDYIEKNQYDSMAIISEKMEKEINDVIVVIKGKPAPDATGGEKFKVDVIKYFEYLKGIYGSYKDYANADSDDKRQEEALKMQNLASKKQEVVKIIQIAQKEFAKANGFKIEQ